MTSSRTSRSLDSGIWDLTLAGEGPDVRRREEVVFAAERAGAQLTREDGLARRSAAVRKGADRSVIARQPHADGVGRAVRGVGGREHEHPGGRGMDRRARAGEARQKSEDLAR